MLFLFSIAGFTFASALCGVPRRLPQMVVYRLLQGVSGAALVPIGQAVLLDINPPAASRAGDGGVGHSASRLGPIMGPALGGWLTDKYNWRWVFYINVPIGLLAMFGIWFRR